jgi:uncharacterized membrane-anchored protein YitT (DUF2179 family)
MGGDMELNMADTHIRLSKVSEKKKELALDTLFLTAGCFIYSASVTIFTAPNKMAPGGITGISTLLHYTIGTPIGTMILILNIPLFVLAFKFLKGKFLIKSIICTAISSVAIDALTFLPKYDGSHGNMLLAALYGGVLSGVGLSLVFLRGSTTGGTDIASRLLKLKWQHVPMGRMMLGLDCCVILVSLFVFKSIDSGLYSMIQLFVSSRVIDAILYGSDTGKMVLVMSDKQEEIAKAITFELNRGITMLKGRGFYTGNDREVLLCAVRRPQTARLRAIVRKIDPAAFMIMCEAGDVIGEGFKPISKDD